MLSEQYFARAEAIDREKKIQRIQAALKESIRAVHSGKPDGEDLIRVADGFITEELVQSLMGGDVSKWEETGYGLAARAIAEHRKPKEPKEVRVFHGLLGFIDVELQGEKDGEAIAKRAKEMITDEVFRDLLNKEVWMQEEAMHALVDRARNELSQ